MSLQSAITTEGFYRALFEQAYEGILLDDGNGKYIEANPEACSMLGYTREELLTLTAFDIVTEESQKKSPFHWERLSKKQTVRLTRSFRRKNGEIIICEMSARGLDDGTVLVILRDITLTRRAEEELKKIRRSLIPSKRTPHLRHNENDDVTFSDIFDVEEIQKIQDSFAEAVGVASLITDVHGQPITRPSSFCPLCLQVRSTPEGSIRCQQSDMHLGKLSAEKGIASQHCLSIGMTDASACIFAGNKIIAFWLIGQVFTGAEDADTLVNNAVSMGIDREQATQSVKEIKQVPAERFSKAVEALHLIANQLSIAAYHNLQQAQYLSERRLTARKLAGSMKKMQRRQIVLAEVSRYPGEKTFDLNEFVNLLTARAAFALEAEYVSVWLGNEVEGQLLCIDRFHIEKDHHTKGEYLFVKQCPVFFETLGHNRFIDATDVRTDVRVAEFVSNGYTSRLHISSVLDATILVNGRLAGIICFEHTGDPRKWGTEEIRFAGDMADKIAMGLLTAQRVQTENDLRESEMRFRQMFQNNSVVMMQIDPDSGYILDVNPAAVNFYGYSRIELLNMNISQINTLSVAEIYSAMQKTRQSRQNYFIFNHRKKSGEIKTVEVYGFTITLHGREIIFSIVHDITDRRAIEEENRKLSLAVEQSPITILITDAQGCIEYVNPRFEEITGYKAEEVKGKNPSILKSGLTPVALYDELWRTIRGGYTWRGELVNRRKDGTLFTESIFITPIASSGEKTDHYLALKEDITVKKQMEDDLLQAKEKAEESDRLKTAFLNNMSHEIRTPMNAIAGFADLLRDNDLTPEERNKYIDIINSNSDQLLGIVNDVLEISRLDSGRIPLHLSRFYLNDLMEDIFQSFLPDIQRRELEFNYNCELSRELSYIETDREKLRQVLIGFISNALKFTERGYIRFGYKVTAGEIRCFVADSGIGIPYADQQRIFDRFYQVTRPDGKNRGGTGLGLSIATGIARLLESTISVESEPGQGSTFTLVVKNTFIHPPEDKHRANNLEGLKSAVVLVAEDEAYNFEYLRALLSRHVAKIHHAANGLIAVQMAEALHPDLILMDLKMPVLDGIEATRLIKHTNPGQVIIAQTAYSQPEELNRLTEAGCAVCLTKPIRRDELLATMAKYL